MESRTEHPNGASDHSEVDQRKPPLRSLLTRPVLLTISNYAVVAFLEILLVPLVYTTPIRYSGLGLDPARMGTCLGVFRIMNGVLQSLSFPPLSSSWDTVEPFVTFVSGLVPAFLLLFPINNTRAQHAGTDIVL